MQLKILFTAICTLGALLQVRGTDEDDLKYGMDKVVLAFDMACNYSVNKECQGLQKSARRLVLTMKVFVEPEEVVGRKMGVFEDQSAEALEKLQHEYQENCKSVLSEPEVQPKYDESKELEDEGKTYPFKAYAYCLVHTLKEISGGGKERDWSTLYFGMDQVTKAYNVVCDFYLNSNCYGLQAEKKRQVLEREDIANQPIEQLKTFGAWSGDSLAELPQTYEGSCKQYLSDAEAVPKVDESSTLEDEGKVYPFKAYAHCLVNTLRENMGATKRDWSMLYFGMDQVVKAYDLVCDYHYTSCEGLQAQKKEQVLALTDLTNKPKEQLSTFAAWSSHALEKLPKLYEDNCKHYLTDADAKPEVKDTETLEDKEKVYPFKAYSHCLLNVLSENSGGKLRKDRSLLGYGMYANFIVDKEKAVQAFEASCEHETITIYCEGKQDEIMLQTGIGDRENNPKKQLIYFRDFTIKHALPRLSKMYKEKCEKYVSDEDAEPPADESKFLNDEGKTYPFKGYAHCLIATLKEISGGSVKKDWSLLPYGMDQTIKAYDMVCEYEGTDCKGRQAQIKAEVLARADLTDQPKEQMNLFSSLSENALAVFSAVFDGKCRQYLIVAGSLPKIDGSNVLEDQGKDYPLKGYAHCLVNTLREISGGAMKKDWSLQYLALEKAVKAYKLACLYEDTPSACEGEQTLIVQTVYSNQGLANQPQKILDTFARMSRASVFHDLSKSYEDNCKKYLFESEADAEPPADESDILDDAGKVYPYKAYAHCLMQTLRVRSNGKMEKDWSMLPYGMGKASQAYEMVCAFEAVSGHECEANYQAGIMDQVLTRGGLINQTGLQVKRFTLWSINGPLQQLPTIYRETCEKYLLELFAEPMADVGNELNDTETNEYPFKAYAYCLAHTLRERSNGSRDYDKIYIGIEKTIFAMEVVCKSEARQRDNCKEDFRWKYNLFLRGEISKNDSHQLWVKFLQYLRNVGIPELPVVYQNCSEYVNNPLAELSAYENDALDDLEIDYPFKAFAHCLMQTLRSECGGTLPPEVEEFKKLEADAPEDYD